MANNLIDNNEIFLLVWRVLCLGGLLAIIIVDSTKLLDYFLMFYHNWVLALLNLSFQLLVLESITKIWPTETFIIFKGIKNDIVF